MKNKNLINMLIDMKNDADNEYDKLILTSIRDVVVDLRRLYISNGFDFGSHTDEVVLATLGIIVSKLDSEYHIKVLHEIGENLEIE